MAIGGDVYILARLDLSEQHKVKIRMGQFVVAELDPAISGVCCVRPNGAISNSLASVRRNPELRDQSNATVLWVFGYTPCGQGWAGFA
jgi:hypothetical protein